MKTIKINVPVYESGNDPWVIKHNNKYYYCWSKGSIFVREIKGLYDLSDEDGSIVYTPEEGTMHSKELWAPELHYLNGCWYIYVACDNGENKNHRMYVLKGTDEDPTKPFEFMGYIGTKDNHWAIDGTILNYKDNMYFIWSGWEGDEDGKQDLYIAHMSDPLTIDSERVCISRPTKDYETYAMPINEGPVCLVDNDDVILVYSGSGSWTDAYCICKMTLHNGDPMNPNDWVKYDEPILKSNVGCYGPGHCSFVRDDFDNLWVVYHANSEPNKGWDGRTCRVQRVLKYGGTTIEIGDGISCGKTIEINVK